MTLHKDIREFIGLCLSRKVDFLLLDGFVIQAIGKEELMRNKKAAGRPQDFADLARLKG